MAPDWVMGIILTTYLDIAMLIQNNYDIVTVHRKEYGEYYGGWKQKRKDNKNVHRMSIGKKSRNTQKLIT